MGTNNRRPKNAHGIPPPRIQNPTVTSPSKKSSSAPAGTIVDGGTFTIPEALGNKVIHPFSDFLLHDVGTGDGIIQAGPPDTANKLRTSPLWGLRTKSRYMHDLKSLTLENAITRHQGEAQEVSERFHKLTPREQQQLLTFLNSL